MQDQTPTQPPVQNGFPIANTGTPVLSTTESHTTMDRRYHAKSVQRLSITQILLGASAILLQIWDIFDGSALSVCGTGIWTGILFIIAGSLGIYSSKTRRTCPVVAFLVMSVIAALFTAPLLILSALSVRAAARYRQYYDKSGSYYSTSVDDDDEYMLKILDMTAGVAALLILISLAEAVIAIISSCFACKVICDSNQQSVLIQGQVQYIPGPDGQTQMVIVPMLNQSNPMTANPPYQLTTPVGGYQNQPLSAPQGEMPAGHGMSLGIPRPHQAQAVGPSQPPTYSGKMTPPPEYEEKEKISE